MFIKYTGPKYVFPNPGQTNHFEALAKLTKKDEGSGQASSSGRFCQFPDGQKAEGHQASPHGCTGLKNIAISLANLAAQQHEINVRFENCLNRESLMKGKSHYG
jgi:hypothetical protein